MDFEELLITWLIICKGNWKFKLVIKLVKFKNIISYTSIESDFVLNAILLI